MSSPRPEADAPDDRRQLRLFRYAMLAAGLIYLVWWKAVDILLPGSFNPFGSRLVVVLFCLLVFAASFRIKSIAEHPSTWFLACIWAVTLHYFYLFSRNASDINWVVGTYIVIIGASASTSSIRALLSYAGFVIALSGLLIVFHPALLHTIFLSGVLTIFVFAYVGLRARLRLVQLSRETAARLQSLFDAVFEGIVVHDHGRILDVNEPFARLFGYERHELLAMEISRLTAPESRELAARMIQSEATVAYEAIGLRKDGSRIPIELAGKRHTLDGRPVRLVAVRDITERKRAERTHVLYEAAQESLRIRDEFTLIISHELKTPITNLKLQTQLAQRELAHPGDSEVQLNRMRRLLTQTDRQVGRLAALIEDVIDVTRIGIGELRPKLERLDLAALARHVTASQTAPFESAGCELKVNAPHPAFAAADPARLEQVLLNLLTNALKYGAGRPVEIVVEKRGTSVVLAVQDHGIGIAPEDQERIFQRFERAVSARHISGLGLGLFICKYIVEAHGGTIEVASRPNEGARFSVVLPEWMEGQAP